MSKLLLFTSPLTQLNTPYPATAYLKGFLQQFDYSVAQADLGIDLTLSIFSNAGLQRIFAAEPKNESLSDNAKRIYALRQQYLSTIDAVIAFLQGKDEMLAHRICAMTFLPQAERFSQVQDSEWAFGTMGIRDKARFLATLYIEDLGDYIREVVSSFFAFTRYAEQIARTAVSFDPIEEALQAPTNLVDDLMLELLEKYMQTEQPDCVGFSIPFSGNLYGALRCGKYLKENYPEVKIIAGGGYPNTELRQLEESRVFNYVDYITLDDGEAPVLQLLRFFKGEIELNDCKRTFVRLDNEVRYIDSQIQPDFEHAEVGTPDYEGLSFEKYLSVIEMTNPMQRLWSDGRWNKLTLAHGCYWHRCTFCDVTLDYIKRYSATSASILVDRIEAVVAQTGERGFHFTDEAAPPALLRDLALELLRRKVVITWWTNIRFEKSYTHDLVKLMAASGCVAVSGGLEVASDRILKLIKKGTNIKQVSKVIHNFSQEGVMVHAYLMYGFPTQTAQETVDALEVVRQLFEQGVLQSAFWHRFTMTVHSPVGVAPESFNVKTTGPGIGTFANNDMFHDDPQGAQHELFNSGLNKAVYNYMLDLGFDVPLHEWFDFKVPRVSVAPNTIAAHIDANIANEDFNQLERKVIWLGSEIVVEKKKKNKVTLSFINNTNSKETRTNEATLSFFELAANMCSVDSKEVVRLKDLADDYNRICTADFSPFLFSKEWKAFRVAGLLLL